MTKLKTLICIFILIICSFSGIAQINSDVQRMLKYWYYRDRLCTEFMIGIGNGVGYSLPVEFRVADDPTLLAKAKWGDGTLHLSYYICVLAMEYKMLSDGGHVDEAGATLIELYWAIEAYNRLDIEAELFYGLSGSTIPNGFFIRDDIGKNFYGGGGHPDYSNPDYIAAIQHLNKHYSTSNPIPNSVLVNDMESDWLVCNFRSPSDPEKYSLAMSKDQIIHIIMAVMTVKSCLPDGLSCGLVFSDGRTVFTEEVTEIYKRILDFIHPPSDLAGQGHWTIFGPYHQRVPRGHNLYTLAYGFSKAYKRITGEHNPSTAITYTSGWSKVMALWATAQLLPSTYNSSEGSKFLNLMTASGCCGVNAQYIYNKSHPGSVWDSYQIPPFYRLFNVSNDLQTTSFYETLLDKAPCFGTYNFGYYHTWEWSSSSLMIHPNSRGVTIDNTKGAYNGLDYLTLYNLYYLSKGKSSFQNLFDRNIITDYPYNSSSTIIGDDLNPEYAIAIDNITATNTIRLDGNATYRAGNEIHLNSGFNVEDGGYFYAYTDKLHCDATTDEDYFRTTSTAPEQILKADTFNTIPDRHYYFEATSYPVPFVNNFNIRLTLPSETKLVINIYDIQGRIVEQVFNGRATLGDHFLTHNLDRLLNGVYICKIFADNNFKSFKIIKTK